MEGKSESKLARMAIPIMMACGLLATASAMAQSANGGAQERRCSNGTLQGDYGYASEGVLLPGPGVVLQFRSVGLTHFDGRGDLRWVEHTVINGTSLESGWTPATGTYSVNLDCTGTATVNTPNSPVPLKLSFVVVRHGSEVHTVLDANAISTVFTKVEDHGRNHDDAGDED